jgi:hypothetical protein
MIQSDIKTFHWPLMGMTSDHNPINLSQGTSASGLSRLHPMSSLLSRKSTGVESSPSPFLFCSYRPKPRYRKEASSESYPTFRCLFLAVVALWNKTRVRTPFLSYY